MLSKKCMKCGSDFGDYDTALHKKLVNRGSKEFMCTRCLAAWLNISEELLLSKVEQFKKQGCTLFL